MFSLSTCCVSMYGGGRTFTSVSVTAVSRKTTFGRSLLSMIKND